MGPPTKFEASKLKVVLLEDQINRYASIIPRTYILSHCDLTANLTLAVSNVIKLEQVCVFMFCLLWRGKLVFDAYFERRKMLTSAFRKLNAFIAKYTIRLILLLSRVPLRLFISISYCLISTCLMSCIPCVKWQLRGWYQKDDVVAEWKKVKNEMCLHVHCFVSGPNSFLDLAAEFRYHIFSKEMPLVCLRLIYIIPLMHPIPIKTGII